MTKDTILEKRFPFLHSHIAREPYVYDILNEIMNVQAAYLKSRIGTLATLDDLKNSRNIKIPFTITRNKTIADLMETLLKTYPIEIRPIITFSFTIDPETKRLSANERQEFTVLLSNEEFNRIQSERNRESSENLLALIAQFRLFNLSKLIKKVRTRSILTQIIRAEIGKNLFAYKHSTIDRRGNETTEDYCFHVTNYEAVRKALNVNGIRRIIETHSSSILRRLKTFGILNTDFDDYDDPKLDYIINVLLHDVFHALSNSEQAEVKNFHALRTCITKAESTLDPLVTSSDDIAALVKESGYCPDTSIAAIFPRLTREKLAEWGRSYASRYGILTHRDENGILYFVDGSYLMPRIRELHESIVYRHDEFAAMRHAEKDRLLEEMGLLTNLGRTILESPAATPIGQDDEAISNLRRIINEYDQYQNRLAITSVAAETRPSQKRRTIIDAIAEFLHSLFSRGREENARRDAPPREPEPTNHEPRPAARGEARDIINAIKARRNSIAPLSNYIELLPANEKEIETIIGDLRKLNIRIVMPVYNARKVLYPIRSQQYLIPDIEYLLIDPQLVQTPETIRDFTDSLAGEKIKDEKLTGAAILAIEKYLLGIYSQKKAAALKKAKGHAQ